MEYQEYPKALYKAGVMIQANSFEDEEHLRADGYRDWKEDHEAQENKNAFQSPEDSPVNVESPAEAPQRAKPGPKPKVK